MARTKRRKLKLDIKFFEVRENMPKSDELTALACVVTLPPGGTRKSAVAFYSKPTSADIEAAAKELTRWGQHQLDRWEAERSHYIDTIIN